MYYIKEYLYNMKNSITLNGEIICITGERGQRRQLILNHIKREYAKR